VLRLLTRPRRHEPSADSSLASTLVDDVSCLSLCSTDELEVRLLDRLSYAGHMSNPVCL